MTGKSSIVSTFFHGETIATQETSLILEQKPFPRNSGDILTMGQVAAVNELEWIPVLAGGTAMSSDFDEVVTAYYDQCGKNPDGSIFTTIYVLKTPNNLPYKIVTNSGVLSDTCVIEPVLKEESVVFKLDTVVSINHLIDSVESIEWEGGVYSSDGSVIQIPNPVVHGTSLVASQSVFGIARIKYTVLSDAYELTVPMREDKTYQATVMAFYGNNQVKTLEVSFPNLADLCTDTASACLGDCETAGSVVTVSEKDSGIVDPYLGADPPDDDYGDLVPINISLEPNAGCDILIEIGLDPGCPPDTPDVTCDNTQNPTEIDQNSSETIYILDGYPPYTWKIVGGYGFSLQWKSTDDLGGRPDERLNSQNTLYSSADSCGSAQVQVTDSCQTEIICEFTCEQLPLVSWDYDIGEETIDRGESGVLIAVKDGTGPYTWFVTPSDFNVGQVTTVGRQNTLNANWVACGSATITVEDACGSFCEGHVRCTTGQWVVTERVSNAQHACGSGFLSPGTGSSTGTFTEIIGNYKVVEETGTTNCGHIDSTSCVSYQSGTCIGPPYTMYGASALQYHYPCICDVNISNFPFPWADCSSSSDWPCCHNASTNRIYSPYWQRFKYEWTC